METDSKTVPAFDRLMWPTLLALKDLGGSANVVELNDKAIELSGCTDEQQAVLHKGGPQTEIRYRLAWARTYLGSVGALQNSARGVWSITEYGRSLREDELKSIPAIVRSKARRTAQVDTVVDSVPEAALGDAETADSAVPDGWKDDLLRLLQAMSPAGFERLCQRLLRESGFTEVDVTGRSGDGGIDGRGVLRVELLSFQVYFQCKRYKGTVGSSDVREFRGAMVGRTDKGLLITTGAFSRDARREATRDGAAALDLIDGDQLCLLLKERGLGVKSRQVEEVTVDSVWLNSV
jgi:restriction system protein